MTNYEGGVGSFDDDQQFALSTPVTKRVIDSIKTGGTYTSQPKDHTGLGEYSDEQLIAELKERGVHV